MDEVDKVIEKFETLNKVIGWSSSILVVSLLVALYFIWKFLNKSVEKSAEISSAKTIEKYKTQLQRELTEHNIKFSTTHQKQIDAIHEIYTHFQALFKKMDYMLHGDKYFPEVDPHKEVQTLITNRTSFINIYQLHKIVLPKDLCSKIESLVPSIEEFIDTYTSGLLPQGLQMEMQGNDDDEQGGKLFLAGIWRHGAFDETLQKIQQVKSDIEDEFRKVYGT